MNHFVRKAVRMQVTVFFKTLYFTTYTICRYTLTKYKIFYI